MPQWILNLNDFPRKNQFPFRVQQIYYCYNMLIPPSPRKWGNFEVCLRLHSDSSFTEDIVDNEIGEIIELDDKSILMVFYAKDEQTNQTVIMQNRWRFEE